MMMKSVKFQFCRLNFFFEGDGNTEGGANGGGTGAGAGAGAGANGGERTYTHAELTALIEAERVRHAENTKATIKSLEETKKSQSLTEKEKSDLAKRIEELQATLLTKDELAKQQLEKTTEQYKAELSTTVAERDTWRQRYVSSQIESGIKGAAIENDAFNPDFFMALLGPKAELVEIIDEETNKPTGKFKTVVKMESREQDGKVLILSPTEAIKTLKEMPDKYGNLFKSNVTGGLGAGGSAGSVTNLNLKNLSHENYLKVRSQIRK